uniref:LAGLIDADG homing endonuclease n=1 Tax=Bryopsis sp. HV04063 TaxID=1979421 RepID=A0A2P0QH48_9CHLO|nr:hypothetical protein [Bryopsis sp. HV04063]ARO74097.1 hypothetical protein [Bryopsis sp. HV04063]
MYLFLESSETTRETIYIDCLLVYDYKKSNLFFIDWFIGFSEENFSFTKIFRKYSNNLFRFEIHKKDPKILYYIKNKLGFGQIQKINDFWIFIVIKQKYLIDLFYLFRLPFIYTKNFYYFFEWICETKIFQKIKIVGNLNPKQTIIQNKSFWITGYLFAKTHFIVYSISNLTKLNDWKTKIIQKISILEKKNKFILNKLTKILNSNKLLPIIKQPNGYQLQINNFFSFQSLYFYLNTNIPNIKNETLKKIVLIRWWRIFLYQIEKIPLTNKSIKRLKKLIKNINTINNY